jgi:outer membrane immunogenic protein
MRKLLLGAAVVAFAAGSAIAADMPLKAPPPAAAPTSSWTGCYVSGGGGYGMWNQDHSTTGASGGVANITLGENTGGGRGWLGRFGGGCDYQLGGGFSNFVIGAFGDYDVMGLSGSMVPFLTFNGVSVLANENESGAWAAGARLGYLVTPNMMTYVNGGWTGTRFDQMNLVTLAGTSTGAGFLAHTYQGWFIGSGVEYALNWLPVRGLFVRMEYRFGTYENANLVNTNFATGAPVGNLGMGDVLHSEKFVQTATTSLVWRFNWY